MEQTELQTLHLLTLQINNFTTTKRDSLLINTLNIDLLLIIIII